MTGLDDAALLAVVAIGSTFGASALPRASWPRRSPAAAILLWQALGLASGLAAVGTLIGLALPASDGGLVRSVLRAAALLRDGDVLGLTSMFGFGRAAGGTVLVVAVRLACLAAGLLLIASLCWVLLAASAAALQARRRQRALLTLLGHRDLAAVLAHERAHLRERHDLVLLPFTALRRAFPRSATCAGAHGAVALLVEMLADDHALRGCPARELVFALVRFGTAGICPAPAGALAVAEGEVAARVTRLLQPSRPLPAVAVMAICLAAALLVAAPVTLLIV